MKYSIEWHEKNLANMFNSLHREEETLKRQEECVERLRTYCSELKTQIEQAKRQGKDSFDPERFLKRKPHAKTNPQRGA